MAKKKRHKKTGIEWVEVDPIITTVDGDKPIARAMIGRVIDWDEINAEQEWQDSIVAEAKKRDRKFRKLVASGMSAKDARKAVGRYACEADSCEICPKKPECDSEKEFEKEFDRKWQELQKNKGEF